MRTDEQPGPRHRSREAPDWRSSALWRSLEKMRIEPEGAALTFAARLARENGWSRSYADAVFEEYRRFLYLAAVAGAVTPSEDVDQAWHLHLTYSRHYWDDYCGTILERPLHHEPTAGGRREAARHAGQYEATLRRYREIFDAPPPADIWPDVAERFASRARWVDASRYWLVPKGVTRRAAALVLASLPIAACTSLAGGSGGGGIALGLLGLLLVMALLAGLILYGVRQDGRRRDGDGGGCGAGSNSWGGSGDCDGSSGCGGGCGGD